VLLQGGIQATTWFNKFLQQLSATLLQMRKGDLIPPDAEISTMNDFVEIMKPFVNMTERIGGEK